jgi:hypothetical protein
MSRARDLRLRSRVLAAIVATAALTAILLAGAASAAHAASSWWGLEVAPAPTTLAPGQTGQIVVSAVDMGDEEVNGEASPVTITDTVPKGIKVIPWGGASQCSATEKTTPCLKRTFAEIKGSPPKFEPTAFPCEVAPASGGGETVTCKFEQTLPPFESLDLYIPVEVELSTIEGTYSDAMHIEGGNAPSSDLTEQIKVGSAATTFGINQYELKAESEGGAIDKQAGSHPFQLTTLLHFNQILETQPSGEQVPAAPALLRDLQVRLPPGLVGDTNADAIPQCSANDFTTSPGNGFVDLCPGNTAVGVAVVGVTEPISLHFSHRAVPVFSLTPAAGEPARFGFFVLGLPVVLDTAVATGGDYSVTASVKDSTQLAQVLSSRVTIWGEPGDASHDNSRGWNCLINGRTVGSNLTHEGCAPETRLTKSFLSLPTSCSGQWESSVLADSWTESGPREADGSPVESDPLDPRWKPGPKSPMFQLEGCDKLPFEPSIEVEPETHAANTPTGLNVDVHLPQAATLALGGLAVSAIKETIVTLPEGVLLSPSAANGLEACSTGLVGFIEPHEYEPGTSTLTFTRHIPEPNELQPGVNFCSNGSKVGVVHIKTPDLPNEIEGGVYLAAQNANPFGSLFAMYIIAQDPVSKVLVKLAGQIELNTATGLITTTFKNTPQLPFEDLKLQLFGGPGASISTPATCGDYTTHASFVPWSTPALPVAASSTFSVTSGAEGTACANPLPLTPGFKAGSTNTTAASFTPFELTLSKPDTNQAPTSLSVTLPPGMAAMLSSVTLCPEPQASQGTCGADSLIGHASATAGLGSQPFTESGGQVFITGPYGGAPFGLSVVIPTKAGPFDFGNVVTRSALFIDPNTAAVTINSALPTMVNTTSTNTGVPVQLKQIHVVVDRPGFQFNPTNCTPKTINGTLTGAQGASAHVSSSFQVANCASLPFHPKLTATTGGKASKANGASLNVNVTSAGLGQANIQKVFLTLPKALPSRLTTIQKACADSIFNANPANCNEGSVIGVATIHTPVLKSALSGPAYLVSHGNAAFPDVEFVLQGEGITLILDGKTDIKKGITYSRFESAPDAPFTTFETRLPTGPHSALTANVPEKENYSLCKTKLVIPTEITAQNGAVIKQETKVGLTGCVAANKAKALSRAQKLKKALRQCNKRFAHNKNKRAACRKQAYKKYGPKKKSSSKKKSTSKKSK